MDFDSSTLLLKAGVGKDGDDGLWSPHESPFIRWLVEHWTAKAMNRFGAIQSELVQWIDFQKHKAGPMLPKPTASEFTQWSPGELKLAKAYLESLPPGAFELDDWLLVVDYLYQRYSPLEVMRADAQMLAARASFMGKVAASHAAMSAEKAAGIVRATPATVKQIIRVNPDINAAHKAAMEFGNAKCCENVVALTDASRADMRKLIIDYQEQVALGGGKAPRESLQTRLFDKFGALNRDWRRIAVTEAGENLNQGLVASMAPGARLQRVEQYPGACPFCAKWDGKVFEVVAADAPKKNWQTQIWPGKNNIGRSSAPRKKTPLGLVDRTEDEMWAPAAGLFHPNCRGRWLVLPGRPKGETELRKSESWGEKEKNEHPRNPKGEFAKVGEKAIIQKMDYMGQRPGLFKLPPILITELTGEEFGQGLTKVQLAKAADVLLLAIQHGAGLFNEDTQWTLKVNRKDRGKMGDNAGQTAEESKAVAGIDSLVRNAVVAERHADTQHKNPDVQAILRMYAPVSIGGTLYRAKLTVQDYKGGDKRHLHALSAVEIENAPLGTLLPYSGAEALQAAQPTTARRLSIAKLMREASMETGVKFTASP